MELVELRKEITELEVSKVEHEWAEVSIKHINAVLRAICTVNQLIAREKDRDKLLKGVCQCLIDTRSCYSAWIALLDETGCLRTTTEAGLGKDFLPMVEQLKRGQLTDCGQRAMRQSDVVVTKDPLSTCADCPLSALYNGRGTITVRLEHDGKIYGLLSVSIPRDLLTDEEEQALFKELASDVGFALHSIQVEEERKRAEKEKSKPEAQLNYAQGMKALGTLAGGMAHNFNNLLMGIQGNTSLMLLETDPAHPNHERLANIEESVQTGSRLTSHLLGYAGKGRYEVKPIDLNQIVEDTSCSFARSKREITIHRELAEELFAIEADKGQIEQVLLNLYANAADAMPGGGELFLKTINVTHRDMTGKPSKVESGNYALLTVRDTGTGMDKKTMERIFDPFFTTKGMSKSMGLGLASVYGIVKAHGGYIDVDSKKGHGTTFDIYLPACEKQGTKEKESATEVVKGEETVLLVDDEDMIVDVCRAILKALGYKVLIARNGKDAVDLYQAHKDTIDMVILDMIMPHMGGGETYDRVKEINRNIKVLLSSGYSIDGEATEILNRGCNGFIQKPFNIKELSLKIREILDKEENTENLRVALDTSTS